MQGEETPGTAHALTRARPIGANARPGLRTALQVAALAAACGLAPSAQANNGLNPIGFSAGTVALGGADTALAIDTTTINANPAGLARVGHRVDLYGAAAHALDVRHRDEQGNDRSISNRTIGFGGGGWSRPLGDTGLTGGIGLLYQGGTGNVFKDVATAFGTTDQLASVFGVVRVAPALAWRIDPHWSVGASLTVNRAEVSQRVFPGTSFSSGGTNFFGYAFKGARDTVVVPRIGVLFEPHAALRFGLAYAVRAKFDLRGHDMRVDYAAIGAGTASYRDVRLEGLALPRQVEAGAVWQVQPRVSIATKVAWLDWAGTLKQSTLSASGADNVGVPQTISETTTIGWRNQWVFATGLAWAATDRLSLRGGINYGRNPVPRDATNPIFAEIGQWHLTTGIEYAMQDGFVAAAAIEYQLLNQVKYANPEAPFGRDAQATSRYVALHLLVARRWP